MPGKINLITGCMFSGKTNELQTRYNKYKIAGKRCVVIKHCIDDRYDNAHVVSHDGKKINAIACKLLNELDDIIKEYDVICIDEIQFFNDAILVCERWANEYEKIIEASGLNGDNKRKPFNVISNLIPCCETIEFKRAVCKETGKQASFTKRLVELNEQIVVGGEDLYQPVDRTTYFEINNSKQIGKINLITGCMFSGKTSELQSRYNKYRIAGKKCIVIKHCIDNRYSSTKDTFVVTHDGKKINAISCNLLNDLTNIITEYDVICIDEIQFFSDAVEICEKWANEFGKIIETSGLNGDHKREPFEIISNLIPCCETIEFKRAVCKYTGKSASFTKRLIESKEQIIVGGEDMYQSVDRITHMK